MPARSSCRTVCRRPPGSVGSTVSANRVFSVLAGGSLRWASWAASTSPLRASATTQDSAETSGTPGVPGCGRACVPERYSRAGDTAVVRGPLGAPGPEPVCAAAVAGASASSPVMHSAQAGTAIREGNPIVIPQS